MTPNDDALRCAAALLQLDGAKKHHPSGPGGQMCGSESYRLIASGFSFYELQNSADHLARLVTETEAQAALLRQIALVAHAGGLAVMSEADALIAIRKLTLVKWGEVGHLSDAAIRQHLEGRA